MVSPRLPYQVQTADMFPPTNNKKASLCPNLQPQKRKHHWQACRQRCAIISLSRDLRLLLSLTLFFFLKRKSDSTWISLSAPVVLLGTLHFIIFFLHSVIVRIKCALQGVEIPFRSGPRWRACDLWRKQKLKGYFSFFFFSSKGDFCETSQLGSTLRWTFVTLRTWSEKLKLFGVVSPPTRKHPMLQSVPFLLHVSLHWDSVSCLPPELCA